MTADTRVLRGRPGAEYSLWEIGKLFSRRTAVGRLWGIHSRGALQEEKKAQDTLDEIIRTVPQQPANS